MDTTRSTLSRVAVVPLVLLLAGGTARVATHHHPQPEVDGDASSSLVKTPPNTATQAAFPERSYAPGTTAVLHLRGRRHWIAAQALPRRRRPRRPARRSAPSARRPLSAAAPPTFRCGSAPGRAVYYYARVVTPGRGAWYAPFVLRPARLGVHRVLVVLPTNTWQAYNFEDDDSWYENPEVHTVDLTRPYVDGGVPPHYHGYDRGFIRWLAVHHEQPDFLSDDDLDRIA